MARITVCITPNINEVVIVIKEKFNNIDANVITQHIENLNKITQTYAARWMDAAISQAMQGHKIDEF